MKKVVEKRVKDDNKTKEKLNESIERGEYRRGQFLLKEENQKLKFKEINRENEKKRQDFEKKLLK